MPYIENSFSLIGYKTSYQKLPAFDLTGFTKFVTSGGEQYDAVRNDGRWDILRHIGNGNNTVYCVASHDDQAPKDHYRYTVAVKASADQFECSLPYDDLFSMRIPESEWLVFEIESLAAQYGKFWQDNPYEMIQRLGWSFNMGVGLHIDVFAPSYVSDKDCFEFWIPVKQLVHEE